MDNDFSNMKTTYEPQEFEDKIYQIWFSNKVYKSQSSSEKFSMVIPPPNVTAALHLGHALNISLQDILFRYHKMNGYDVMWAMGTDHAGIATQNVVERIIEKEGYKKEDLGREKFVQKTWQVKQDHHKQITNQIKKMGALVDWDNERFTLDEGLSDAVFDIFKSLYDKGFVYKGRYLINWSVGAKTALSDDEVEYKEISGFMYYIKYPIKDSSEEFVIATTRPETMLGDVAVAINPNDQRYKHLIGKEVVLPITNRLIPIISDSYVLSEFGTGAVKITPSHDPNDYEIGIRHNLDFISVIDDDGKIANSNTKYDGLDRFVARDKIIQELDSLNLFAKKEKHKHKVGHCYRTNTVVEPKLSTQWFVKMQPLTKKAIDFLKNNDIEFYPKRWGNVYLSWLENIKDWCISRQLWWGHRIPVYYCKDCLCEFVQKNAIQCFKCSSKNISQEEDVLDTWFSSWLWPFSVFGYPEESQNFKRYFPTTTLVTGYDIIFFWVSRMLMASGYKFDKAPFKKIYITPLIRDKKGQKMSKSKGNGINPLLIIDKFGSDALRFTFSYLSVLGQDINISEDSFMFGKKFANKIYNASRFLLINLQSFDDDFHIEKLKDEDKWILSRYENALLNLDNFIKSYRFQDSSKVVFDFFWKDFCDWYIEIKKIDFSEEESKKQASKFVLYILKNCLKILHPFLPFITEELYQKLNNNKNLLVNELLVRNPDFINKDLEIKFDLLQKIIVNIRTLKSEFGLKTSKPINIELLIKENKDFINNNIAIINHLIPVKKLDFVDKINPNYLLLGDYGVDIGLDVKDDIDKEKIKIKFEREIEKCQIKINQISKTLSNEDFLKKAKEEVIKNNEIELEEFNSRVIQLNSYISQF